VKLRLALGFSCLLAVTNTCAAGDLEWKDLGGGRLQLLDRGKPALIYNYGPQLPKGVPADRRRASYIYPLWTPAGVSMMDDFPKDHYHHRGLFWGWPVVEVNGKSYDLWKDFKGIENRMDRWLEKKAGSDKAVLAVENGWYVPEAGGRIVKETVRIHAGPATASERVLEITVELEATRGPVTLKGSQEKRKSYGGVSVRFAPRTGTRITADSGVIAKDEDLGSHTWAALEADYPGKVLLRIDSDPSNPGGAAQQWCLRHYGFVGASYPGQAGITLEKGRPLRLRYQVTVKGSKVG
jgi:hypothetical protein